MNKSILSGKTLEIYPSHIRLNFADDESNTAWPQDVALKTLEKVEDSWLLTFRNKN